LDGHDSKEPAADEPHKGAGWPLRSG
jgi:hypothetical protein